MNNQEIQIIAGILLLLIYVFFIRNKEGYKGKGKTSCQSRAIRGRTIFKRVRPLKRCNRNGRPGYISKVNRIMVPLARGRIPVNKGSPVLEIAFMMGKNDRDTRNDLNKIILEGAKKGGNYIETTRRKDAPGGVLAFAINIYKGASTATKAGALGKTKAKFILTQGRAQAMKRQRKRKDKGGMSKFIQRCKNMFRRRKIPVGDTPRMRARRASLSPQQWARDDK